MHEFLSLSALHDKAEQGAGGAWRTGPSFFAHNINVFCMKRRTANSADLFHLARCTLQYHLRRFHPPASLSTRQDTNLKSILSAVLQAPSEDVHEFIFHPVSFLICLHIYLHTARFNRDLFLMCRALAASRKRRSISLVVSCSLRRSGKLLANCSTVQPT